MTPPLPTNLRQWSQSPLSRRSLLLGLAASALASTSVGRAIGVTAPSINLILGRPTATSIAFNMISTQELKAYIEYGYTKGQVSARTRVFALTANAPGVFELTGLKPDSRVFYRLKYAKATSKTFQTGRQLAFSTPRKTDSNFAFTVQGDTHPERAGKMFDSDLYFITMGNVASQQPDFHILLGDDFSIDPLIAKGQATTKTVEGVYRTHRDWLGVIGTSVPIFLVNGNHEQAAAYLLDGTERNPAVLAGRARLKYYALPAPNRFYTGDTSPITGIGLPRDYYAWTWGDALFVTLDPYWHSKYAVDNLAGASDDKGSGKTGGNGKTKDLWTVGIGDEQYAWLKKTLESSTAKYKFVFAHHVMGTGRGAVELSYDYEWGGRDPKGITTFEKERPNWEIPIHDLMVKHGVSIFFQGHDHIFVTQERDGLIYQSMPNPADDTFSLFNDTAYKSGTTAPNSGHVRVSVNPSEATVEYFLAAQSSDLSRKNLQLAHKYTVAPKAT